VTCCPTDATPLAAIQRLAGSRPLFEVLFNYMDFHVLDTLAAPVEFKSAKRSEETELTLIAHFRPRLLALDYDAAQLAPEQVEAICHYYEQVLRHMAARPEAHHDADSLLPIEPCRTAGVRAWPRR
jgi:hypothetical protein